MVDLLSEVEEDLRRERLEKLWKRYGVAAVAAAVTALLIVTGLVLWRDYRARIQAEAGTGYVRLLEQVDGMEAAGAARTLLGFAEETGAGFAILARFRAAGAHAEADQAQEAVALYDAIAADGDVPQPLRDLARILAALNLVQAAPRDQVEQRLAPLRAETSPWRYTAREIAAFAAIDADEIAVARDLLETLADDLDAPGGARARATELLLTLEPGTL